ncbi:MAG: hypothetical protein ACQEXB_24430 [Bacillota bacterium]
MTVKELIEELSKMPGDTDVYVWEGYNAGCLTTEFDVEIDAENDIVLQP